MIYSPYTQGKPNFALYVEYPSVKFWDLLD
jgi:hypothetical protein